jgi:hypothetical protein
MMKIFGIRERKEEDTGEKYIMRSFIVCTLHQM